MLAAIACAHATSPTPQPISSPRVPYAELPRTRINLHGPSTGSQELPTPPDGVVVVHYPSGEHELLAWLALPDATGKVPGLVYFHGAFALSPSDVAKVRPALDAGFAVLLPALRGENGNPGHLELLAGEVDDAVAAVAFLAAHDAVDGARLYTLGHSVGGALSALVSLRPDAPVRLTASVGGIYVPETFQRWSTMKRNRALVRFDPFDPIEGRLRTLGPNTQDMVRPHHAYIGSEDAWFADNAATVRGPLFFVHGVPGDHESSIAPGLVAFVELAAADARAR